METSETTEEKTPKNDENKIKKKQWSTKKKKLVQELTEMGFSEFVDSVGDVDGIPITKFVEKLLTESPGPIDNIPVVEDDGDELWEITEETTPKNDEYIKKKKKWSTKKKKFEQELTEMGFSEILVIEFVDNVGDVNGVPITQFVEKLLTKSPRPIENIPVVEDDDDELWEDVTDYNDNMMVILINIGLNMSVGMVAAQTAHAALGLHELIKNCADLSINLISWNNQGCSKIVVEANNTNQLLRVCPEGKIRKIPLFCEYDLKFKVKLISLIALAFFGSDQELQPLTGQLKKLN